MCRTPHNGMGRRKPKKQVITVVFLVCFIVVSLLSGAFILKHAGHTHDHNGAHGACATCIQIQYAENLLKLLGTAAVGGIILFAGHYTGATIVGSGYSYIAVLTPIASKTRMNN